LTDVAKAALAQELANRGMHDLSGYEKMLREERDASEAVREQRLAWHARMRRLRSRLVIAVGALTCVYGGYRVATPAPDRPGDDGGLLLVIGGAMMLAGWVDSLLSKIWAEKILYRRPPT